MAQQLSYTDDAGNSFVVSTRHRLPVDVGGSIQIDNVNATIDLSPVVDAVNQLRNVVEILETDIDAGPTPTGDDLKTRVSQIKASTDALLAPLQSVVTRLETIRDLIDGPTTNDVRGDLANLLDRLTTIRDRIGTTAPHTVLSLLQEVVAVLQSVVSYLSDIHDLILDNIKNAYLARLDPIPFSGANPTYTFSVSSILPNVGTHEVGSIFVYVRDANSASANAIGVEVRGRFNESGTLSETIFQVAPQAQGVQATIPLTKRYRGIDIVYTRTNTSYSNFTTYIVLQKG